MCNFQSKTDGYNNCVKFNHEILLKAIASFPEEMNTFLWYAVKQERLFIRTLLWGWSFSMVPIQANGLWYNPDFLHFFQDWVLMRQVFSGLPGSQQLSLYVNRTDCEQVDVCIVYYIMLITQPLVNKLLPTLYTQKIFFCH